MSEGYAPHCYTETSRGPHHPVNLCQRVGPGRAAMLEAKGLLTVEDLLAYVPFRYEDRSNMKPICAACAGRNGDCDRRSALGEDVAASSAATWAVRGPFTDASRAILDGKWFHGGYLANVLAPRHESGAVRQGGVRQLLGRSHDAASGVRNSGRDDDEGERRCTSAASCRSTKPRQRSRPRVFRSLVHRMLDSRCRNGRTLCRPHSASA